MIRSSSHTRLGTALVFAAAACAAPPSDELLDGPEDGKAEGGGVIGASVPNAGPRTWQRLTNRQYDNTVRALLGDDSAPASKSFSAEGSGTSGFSSPSLVSVVDVDRFRAVAEQLATSAVPKLVPGKLLPCDPASGEDACAEQFITKFGTRAFRRPLEATELGDLKGLYKTARTELAEDFKGGLRIVIGALLQSPDFLYHWQIPSSDAAQTDPKFASYAVASRLSYFLQNTMPDDSLFEAAATGKLTTEADIEAQARRLLAMPEAREALESFHVQWLHLQNVTNLNKIDPAWPGAKAAVLAETFAFVDHVLREGDGSLATLLTAPFSFVNQATAPIYGVDGVTGDAFVKRDLPNRWGLLTQASVLAAQSKSNEDDPILRGKLVRENLLCHKLPPVPPNVPELPKPDETVSNRKRHEQHMAVQPCKGCHMPMDPIGFGLGNYDAIGRYRTKDGAHDVDARGTIFSIDGKDIEFNGARELATILSESDEVRRCVMTKWFRYAFGRGETALDQPSIDGVYQTYSGTAFNVREMLVAIVKSPSFRRTH